MQFAHTCQYGLARIFIGVHEQRRILLDQLGQGLIQLVDVCCNFGFDGDVHHRLGELDVLEHQRFVFDTKRIARADELESDGGTDVASRNLFQGQLFVGMHLNDLGDAFALARRHVQHHLASFQRSGIDAEETKTTDEGIRGDLERQGAERLLGVGLADFLLFGLRIDTLHVVDVQGAGQVVDDGVKQGLHALVLERRAAHHGANAKVKRSLADLRDEFGFGDAVGVFHILLKQHFVVFDGPLDESGAVFRHHVFHVLGDFDFVEHGAVVLFFPSVRLIPQQVDHANELVFGTDGQLDGDGSGVKSLLDLVHYLKEIGACAVHLVDVADAGDVVLVGLMPHGFRLRLDTADGAEDGDGAIEDAQRTLHFDGEVDVAGRVNDVDFVGLIIKVPENRCCGRGDGDATFLLLNHPVHGGGAVVNLTYLMAASGVIQNTLRRRRLTGVDVCHDANVARQAERVHISLDVLHNS